MSLNCQITSLMYTRLHTRNYLADALREAVVMYLTDLAAGKPVPPPQALSGKGQPLRAVTVELAKETHYAGMRLVAAKLKVPVSYVMRAALTHYIQHSRAPSTPIVRQSYPVPVTVYIMHTAYRALYDAYPQCKNQQEVLRAALDTFLRDQPPIDRHSRPVCSGDWQVGARITQAQSDLITKLCDLYGVSRTRLIQCAIDHSLLSTPW
jgi:hypothetical protein